MADMETREGEAVTAAHRVERWQRESYRVEEERDATAGHTSRKKEALYVLQNER